MPEPVIHFSVVFALSAPRLGIKRALLLSTVAILPDLDVLFHVHRSMSHSIIVLSLIWTSLLLALYVLRRRYLGFGFLCFLASLSHLLMDCFQTYTPIFYPVLNEGVWVMVGGWVSISSEGFKPYSSFSVTTKPTTFSPMEFIDAPLFTSEGFIISFLLMVFPLFFGVVRVGKVVGIGDVWFKKSLDGRGLAGDTGVMGCGISKDMVTVVIPTLNEEEAIGRVIDELVVEGYKNILVVDGHSSDRTVEVARSRGVNVVYQKGVGKADAVATAVEMVSTPYMVVMDGDCTYDPKDVGRLLRYAGESDEVIGYRSSRGNIPLLHRVGNKIISLVFSLLFGRQVKDPCSGMYLLRTDVARRLEITSGGFNVEVEIAGQLTQLGKVTEVPVSYRRRVGRSKLRAWRDGLGILVTAVKVMWLYNPVFLLSALVALLLVPGAVILLHQFMLRYFYGAGAWSLGWSWLGLVLFVAGLQGIALATMSIMLKRMERRMLQVFREVGATSKN